MGIKKAVCELIFDSTAALKDIDPSSLDIKISGVVFQNMNMTIQSFRKLEEDPKTGYYKAEVVVEYNGDLKELRKMFLATAKDNQLIIYPSTMIDITVKNLKSC